MEDNQDYALCDNKKCEQKEACKRFDGKCRPSYNFAVIKGRIVISGYDCFMKKIKEGEEENEEN